MLLFVSCVNQPACEMYNECGFKKLSALVLPQREREKEEREGGTSKERSVRESMQEIISYLSELFRLLKIKTFNGLHKNDIKTEKI